MREVLNELVMSKEWLMLNREHQRDILIATQDWATTKLTELGSEENPSKKA